VDFSKLRTPIQNCQLKSRIYYFSLMKFLVKTASILFPNQVVNFAYNQLSNPQVRKIRDYELAILAKAEKSTLEFQNFKIQTYRWGSGTKQILLIHGWEGQAGNFAELIEKLLENDYTIHAFDGPSHGFSSRGPTSLFEFSELVGFMIRKTKAEHLVSHSFGGVATTSALFSNPDLKIKKYALLTTPDKFTERIQDVSDKIGITEKVKNKLISRLENEMNISAAELNVSDYVKNISVENALIIHDKNDRVIPIRQSKNVDKNWKASELVEIEGTGHFRILRTGFVIEKVVDFLD